MGGRRYEVLGIVGRGSAGTVYHARMHGEGGFSKDVALKVLQPTGERDAADIAQRLRDEARVLGLVSHRAIVSVDALVQLDGRWTVVMEYVPGANLFDLTHAETDPSDTGRRALPARVAVEIVSELASALDVAFHTRGPDSQPLRLLHRDLKPSNL
ncbi:MAG: protein kinase, partial [Myxococcota bacterium]